MERLTKGMLIETNYSGPYRIVSIRRGCTCPDPVDEINNPGDAKDRVPHIHLTLSNPNGKGRFWINGILEEKLRSIKKSYCNKEKLGFDTITILPAIQISMF